MEALAIVVVVVVAALIWVVTWFGVQNQARDPASERQHLEAYRATLLKKVARAQAERWDDTMLHRLAEEIRTVDAKLGRLRAGL